MSGHNKVAIDHIVDSYEIYGEDKPDDDSEHEEYVPKKRGKGS